MCYAHFPMSACDFLQEHLFRCSMGIIHAPHARIQRGLGSGCFLINHKAKGFRRNTGADSLDKAQSDPGNIQCWAIKTPFKWCFAGWSLMAVDCRLLLDETFCIAHFSRIYSNEHLNKCIFGNACIQNLILL